MFSFQLFLIKIIDLDVLLCFFLLDIVSIVTYQSHFYHKTQRLMCVIFHCAYSHQLRVSICHCVKSVRIRSFSGRYFPAIGLNTERYGVSLRIQSKYGDKRTRKTPNTETSHRVCIAVSLKQSQQYINQYQREVKHGLRYLKNGKMTSNPSVLLEQFPARENLIVCRFL